MAKRVPSARKALQLDHPWRVPASVSDLPDRGRHYAVQPDAGTREAVARAVGVVALPRLQATYDLRPAAGNGVRISGTVSATVEQTCVVSLEPVMTEIVEPVDLLLVPQESGPATAAMDLDPDEEGGPEPLVGGIVDLGVLSVEFLVLGIDPYPRKPGVVFEPPAAGDEPAAKPFAALAALKRNSDTKSS